MPGPNENETFAEHKIIMLLRNNCPCIKRIIKTQAPHNDDGAADGIVELNNGKELYVETRRKGFRNHHEQVCELQGWDDKRLVDGIYLNKSTFQKYIDMDKPFCYVVEIMGDKTKACILTKERIEICMAQESIFVTSTNKKKKQPVKRVLLEWFKNLN